MEGTIGITFRKTNMKNSRMTILNNFPGRRGAASIVALAGLVLLAMIAAAMLRAGVARRDNAAVEESILQTDWLVEAGLERAFAQLTADPDYEGETWEIPAEALGDRGALVRIKVETKADRKPLTVHVEADYPADSPRRVRMARRFLVNLEGDAEASEGDS
ncbi:hypothetical protein BH23PLA1_BH23PLA1_14560 [soil metagenome]